MPPRPGSQEPASFNNTVLDKLDDIQKSLCTVNDRLTKLEQMSAETTVLKEKVVSLQEHSTEVNERLSAVEYQQQRWEQLGRFDPTTLRLSIKRDSNLNGIPCECNGDELTKLFEAEPGDIVKAYAPKGGARKPTYLITVRSTEVANRLRKSFRDTRNKELRLDYDYPPIIRQEMAAVLKIRKIIADNPKFFGEADIFHTGYTVKGGSFRIVFKSRNVTLLYPIQRHLSLSGQDAFRNLTPEFIRQYTVTAANRSAGRAQANSNNASSSKESDSAIGRTRPRDDSFRTGETPMGKGARQDTDSMMEN